MNRCVSWLLLLSYAVLLVMGVGGMWLSWDMLADEDTDLPTPAPGSPEDTKMKYFATRFYLMVPCGVAAITAATMIVVGLFCRDIFSTTTASLYSSVSIFVVTLASAMRYQLLFLPSYSPAPPELIPAAELVVSFQAGIMVFLLLQVVLGMWELRRQKASWPTINFSKLLTWECLFLAVRVIVAMSLVRYYFNSPLSASVVDRYKRGMYSLSVAVAAGYTLVTVMESTLSLFFGTPHKHWVWVTALQSCLYSVFVATLSSPVMVQTLIPNGWVDIGLMIVAIISSGVLFAHTLAYWFMPELIRRPPSFCQEGMKFLSTAFFTEFYESAVSNLHMEDTFRALLPRSSFGTNTAVEIPMTIKKQFLANLGLFVWSVILICLLSVNWTTPIYLSWGAAVLLGVDLALLCRTLPPVVALFFAQYAPTDYLLCFVRSVLELMLVFVGAVGLFFKSNRPGLIIMAVIHLVSYAIMAKVLINVGMKSKKETDAAANTSDSNNTSDPNNASNPDNSSDPDDAQLLRDGDGENADTTSNSNLTTLLVA